MINTKRAVTQSSVLAEEWHKHGRLLNNTEYTRSKKRFYGKAKSDETKAKEASERRYTRRSNICPNCNMAMPMTGCDCE